MADLNPIKFYYVDGKLDNFPMVRGTIGDHDTAHAAAMRLYGLYDPTESFYRKNRVVWFEGVVFAAIVDIDQSGGAVPPIFSETDPNWRPITLNNGNGMMGMQTSPASFSLDNLWIPINGFDFVEPGPVGVQLDHVTDTFVIDYHGNWDIHITCFISHDSVNSGRNVGLRLYDVTNLLPFGNPIKFSTGRNADGTNMQIGFRHRITTPGDTFRFEIGGFNDYAGVVYEELSVTFLQVAV